MSKFPHLEESRFQLYAEVALFLAGTRFVPGGLNGAHHTWSWPMLDHVNLRVTDYERSKKFYQAALAPLGLTLAMEVATGAAFHRKGSIPVFWVKQGEPMGVREPAVPQPLAGCGGPSVHVAFAAKDHSEVDAFYRAAMTAGGRDNGAPGFRPDYHPGYYGAFVLDPDGYNIEAVCHKVA